MADIVVYGGGLQGCAAAAKAAGNAPDKSVALIVPDPVPTLGGLGTIGGQNIFDIKTMGDGSLPQAGTFGYLYNTLGQFYNTDTLASLLVSNLALYRNITYHYMFDVENFQYTPNPYQITALSLRSIYRDTDGYVKWGTVTRTITGTVFIDASDEGRLLRLFHASAVTVGRYDWPADYLDRDETSGTRVARQQAATLMFQMTGIDVGAPGNMSWRHDPSGAWGGGGGIADYKTSKTIIAFNNYNGPHGYAIKPLNAAQNGPGSPVWWVNAFLIFNVDGRAYSRDKGTWRYPAGVRSDYVNVDQAWVNAREFLKNNASLVLTVLRQFTGFSRANFVYNGSYPVVGSILYLRETIHAVTNAAVTVNGAENTNYQLLPSETLYAGPSPGTGSDTANYNARIGLGFYQADINAYKFGDLKNASGAYIWGLEVENKLRPDLGISDTVPANPVYVPFTALLTNYVANLLLPGYAAGCSSISWAEMRTLPNLCVLGDAAGVAAAYCVKNRKFPLALTGADISAVQTTLRSLNARLEK